MHKPIQIERNGLVLWGVEHFPDNSAQVPVVIIVPGLLGTKVGPHRMLRKISLLLEDMSVASVRVDLSGSGESDGEMENATFSSQVLDIEAVIASLQEDCRVDPQRIGLIGVSMGGLVAAVAAGRNPSLERLALLSPLVNLPEISRRLMANRPRNKNMDFFDYYGNRFGIQFGRDLGTWDIPDVARQYQGDVLLVQGTGKGDTPWQDIVNFRHDIYGNRCTLTPVEGANHLFDGSLWEAQVLEAIGQFWSHE